MKHLDLTYILENVSDDPSFVNMLLDVFVDSLDADISALKRSITNSDHEQIRRDAHKVKSGFRSLGMKNMASKLQTIEDMGKNNGAIDEINGLFSGLEAEIPEVLSEINAYKSLNP